LSSPDPKQRETGIIREGVDMAILLRILLFIEVFCYWLFIAAGFQSVTGRIAFFTSSTASVVSIYYGMMWSYSRKNGEGLAWAVIGSLVFAGLTLKWLIS